MDEDRKLLIPTPPLFSFDECIWFLNRNYDDCLHIITHNKIVKAVRINEQIFLLSIEGNDNYLELKILQGDANSQDKIAITEYITDWFNLDKPIELFYELLKKEELLSFMCDDYRGLRLIGISDLFEALCWSIIGQQINLTFAYKLKRRLVEEFGTKISFENEAYYIFPTCKVLASAKVEDLRSMQFSEKKAEYIIGVSKAFAKGEISKEIIKALPSLEHKQKALLNLRGIGIWTANYALMKSLRVSNCIPYGDVGLMNALINHNIIKERNETEKINDFFKKYQGWESYLVFYFWRSLSNNKAAVLSSRRDL